MSKRSSTEKKDIDALDKMIEEITVDAYGQDEQLWAFRQAFADNVELPADGFIIGEPVLVIEIDYDGNERRGLIARCRRENGAEYVVAATDVVLSQASAGARHIAAYRRWLNLDPYPDEMQKTSQRAKKHRATADDIEPGKPVELVVLAIKELAARCRLMGSERNITLRASGLWNAAPGVIVTVIPQKTGVMPVIRISPERYYRLESTCMPSI